jgi:hypothetical protein
MYKRGAGREEVTSNWGANEALDVALFELAKQLKSKDPSFLPSREMGILSQKIQELTKSGVINYFTDSFDLFSSWSKGPEHIREIYDDLESELSRVYHEEESKYTPKKRCRDNSLGKKMPHFVPNIRRLGEMSF